MRMVRMLSVLAMVLFATSIVRADSTSYTPPPASLTPIALGADGTIDPSTLVTYDSTLVPGDSGLGANNGPHGSPPLDPIVRIACPPSLPSCTSATVDYTVVSGTVTAVTETLSAAYNVGTFFCGPSDALLNVNFFASDVGGTYTCKFVAYSGPPVIEPPETIGQMQQGCLATNLANLLGLSALYSDPDDCAGVSSESAYSDLVLSQFDTTPGATSTAAVTITPEPGSVSLLLAGMVGLFIFRRKLAC
jgi:hypothetical protein